MKKNIFFILGLVVIMAACNSSDSDTPAVKGCINPSAINYNPDATEDDGSCIVPNQKQFGFAINYTAKWCGPCGSWGAPAIHALDEAGDVVSITAHASNDPMHIPTLYNAFTSCRPTGGGIPSFYVGDDKTYDVGSMTALLAKTPDVGLEFVATEEGGVMKIRVKTLFFNAVSGDYYLSVYILEDGIPGGTANGASSDYLQNGASDPNYTHDFVLRAAAGDLAYGEMIATGAITAGTSTDKTYEIAMNASWVNHVYVAVCVWKYNAGSGMYEFVNAIEKH